MEKLSPRELTAWLADQTRPAPLLIDVREEWEVALCKIEGARHIPMATIPSAAADLPEGVPLVIYCHHGVRSMQVANFLERQGRTPVYNLQGGIDAWAYDVAPEMNHY